MHEMAHTFELETNVSHVLKIRHVCQKFYLTQAILQTGGNKKGIQTNDRGRIACHSKETLGFFPLP